MRKALFSILVILLFFALETNSTAMGPNAGKLPRRPAERGPADVKQPAQDTSRPDEAGPTEAGEASPETTRPVITRQPEAEQVPAEEMPTELSPPGQMQPGVKAGGEVSQRVVRTTGNDSVSFYFDDADVFEVINTVFGEVLRVNYIIDPRVTGRVNFRTTTPIPRKEILPVMEIILRLNGIGIVQERGLYRIIPLPEISREPAPVRFGKGPVEVRGISIVQIVPLEYIESPEMVKILTPLLTQGGLIVDISGKNYLMIADTDANMKRLLQVVDIFDREEVLDVTKPRVYVYPLQNSKADHMAEILQEIFLGGAKTLKAKKTTVKKTTPNKSQKVTVAASLEEPLVTPGTKIFPDEIANSLIILTTPKDYPIIEEVIKKLDLVPRQVLIEVLVAEVKLKDELEFGIEWFLKSKFNLDNTSLSGITGFGRGSITPGSPVDPSAALSGFTFTAIDAADVIRGLLQTLAKESKAKVIASPHIMVSDNREARMQVGDQIPVQTSQSETSAGTLVTSVQYRDTGSVLKVKPQINDGGLVSLDIKQEFSDFQLGAGVQNNPIISNRTAETHVVVQDGQTVVIGGLIQEKEEASEEGVPLLKDIPLLGYLFGYSLDTKNRTELIVLITPHVVKSIDEARIVTDEFRKKLKGLHDILESDAQKKRIPPEGQETGRDNPVEETPSMEVYP